jgi:hypothetical protein
MAILELVRVECTGTNCPEILSARATFSLTPAELPVEIACNGSFPEGSTIEIPPSNIHNDASLWIFADFPDLNLQNLLVGFTLERFRDDQITLFGEERKTIVLSVFPPVLPPTCELYLYYRIQNNVVALLFTAGFRIGQSAIFLVRGVIVAVLNFLGQLFFRKRNSNSTPLKQERKDLSRQD